MNILPTVGRMVWYWPRKGKPSQPMAATIAYVHEDNRHVNIGGLLRSGVHFSEEGVELIQEGETPPEGRSFIQWMPYQIGQAKKHEGSTS